VPLPHATPDLFQDVAGVVALSGLLLIAHRHPRPAVEALAAILAGGLVLATGLIGPGPAWTALQPLLPVVGFLVAILVVAEVCARAGAFATAARYVEHHSRGRPELLLLGVFLLAALVTTVLSLDATVVLLTPVVLVAARHLGTSPRPAAYACLRMANSGSLLLPVSNLTNLLAAHHLGLGFAGFAARMVLPFGVTLLIEYVGLRLLFGNELRRQSIQETPAGAAQAASDESATHAPLMVPLATVAGMLTAFAALSPLGVPPFWPAAGAAGVLLLWARRRRLLDLGAALRAGHPSFALFVLALGVVVAGLGTGFLGDAVHHVLPRGTGFADLLLIAIIATLAAALLTNLSATLLLLPLVAPIGVTAGLAALLGLGIGAGLTWTGSLANLLWRRVLVREGVRPSHLLFHRVSFLLTPVSLVAATAALSLVS